MARIHEARRELKAKSEMFDRIVETVKSMNEQAGGEEAKRLDDYMYRSMSLMEEMQALREEVSDLEAEEADHSRRVDEAARREDAGFWFRRFMLGLQIANGGAFAAITAGVFQADDPALAARLVHAPYSLFAAGLLAAGLIPFALWGARVFAGRKNISIAFSSAAQVLPLGSAVAFVIALFLSTGAMENLGKTPSKPDNSDRPVEVSVQFKPAPAAQTKAVSPPTSPSAPAATSPPPSRPLGTPAPPPHRSGPPGGAGRPVADRTGGRG